MFNYLHLNVPSGLRGPSEHRGTANDDCTRLLAWGHILDELIQGFIDAGVLIRRDNERIAFLLEDCTGTVDCRVDQGNYLETRTKFAVVE
jgi:hypothetical protein